MGPKKLKQATSVRMQYPTDIRLTLTASSRKYALPGLLVAPVSTERRGAHRNLEIMSIASAE